MATRAFQSPQSKDKEAKMPHLRSQVHVFLRDVMRRMQVYTYVSHTIEITTYRKNKIIKQNFTLSEIRSTKSPPQDARS